MTDADDRPFEALLEHLRSRRGFDFTGYKRASLMRRTDRRLQMVGVESYEAYQDYLKVHPEEFALLFDTILINVTAFFRDAPAWDYLAREVIPRLLEGKAAAEPIRVWSAGCSSGEETYTLAIILAEAMGAEAFRQRIKIYATDIDEGALAEARQATYSAKGLSLVPEELRRKYFEPLGSRYVVRADLRRAVIFGRNDLAQDAPISHLDLLCCRNTLMYFNAETQGRILNRLHFALNDQGFLFLGRAEMLLTHANLFTPLCLKHRVFTKMPGATRDRLLPPIPEAAEYVGNRVAQQVRLREAAFELAPVAQIVLDLSDTLVMANSQARSLLGLGQKDLGSHFRDLEVSYRPLELRSVIEQVAKTRRPSLLREAAWTAVPGEFRQVDVEVAPLLDNGSGLVGVGISFQEITESVRLRTELERARHELETAYEELQSTNEELETTNEELQSTNEELETTNEELQATNEELETMNEELQSTNEELQTMNDELRLRTEEINDVNAFLQSVLGGLSEGVVSLDEKLAVTSWNRKADDMWGLRADEVQGKSLLSLDLGLPLERLKGPMRAVLAGESTSEGVVVDATTRRGKSIKCRVTCTPRLGPQGGIRGVILLMEEG